MPNTPVSAAGEAMPAAKMNRRAVLAGTVAAAATLGASSAGADPSFARLMELIEAHKEAYALDQAAWDRIPEEPSGLLPKVQVGKLLLVGRDDDGSDRFEPIFAYSHAEIERKYEGHRNFDVGRWCHHPENRAKAEAVWDAKIKAKKDELDELEAELKRREDECGYTAAHEVAVETQKIVNAIEAEIVAFVPATLDEAAAKAAWFIYHAKEDGPFNSYVASDMFEDVLKSIAAAGAGVGQAAQSSTLWNRKRREREDA